MVCGEKRNSLKCRHLSPDPCDRCVHPEKGVISVAAKGAYGPRSYNSELRKKIVFATRYFIRFRIAVSRGTALEDIADKNVVSLYANSFDKLIEQFACPADERTALVIFFFARRFTDENDVSVFRVWARGHRIQAMTTLLRPSRVGPSFCAPIYCSTPIFFKAIIKAFARMMFMALTGSMFQVLGLNAAV